MAIPVFLFLILVRPVGLVFLSVRETQGEAREKLPRGEWDSKENGLLSVIPFPNAN